MPSHTKKPKYNYGKSNDDLDNQKWFKSGMETHGSVLLYNKSSPKGRRLGTMKNNTSKAFGCEHAEDVFIRYIKANIGLCKVSPEVNEIILSISKSPCSSTYGTTNKKGLGCAEELVKFQNNPYVCPKTNNEYIFKVIVLARGVYLQSTKSHQAIRYMQRNGIEISTDVHRKKDGSAMMKEYESGMDYS